jgi:hypothetical protein
MSAEVLRAYLLDDRGEVFPDLRLEVGREAGADGGGARGHSTAHCVASVTRSGTACTVSLVRATGREGKRLVAITGIRKSIYWR